MNITVQNANSLGWKHPGIDGITTKAGKITGWPVGLPTLTQELVDGYEVEYAAHLIAQADVVELAKTDQSVARVFEDFMDYVVANGTLPALTDLPKGAQDKWADRKAKRAKIK